MTEFFDMLNLKLYTPQEIAKNTPLSLGKVYEEIQAGNLPAKKVGRRYVISQANLEKYFNQVDNKPEKLVTASRYRRQLTPAEVLKKFS